VFFLLLLRESKQMASRKLTPVSALQVHVAGLTIRSTLDLWLLLLLCFLEMVLLCYAPESGRQSLHRSALGGGGLSNCWKSTLQRSTTRIILLLICMSHLYEGVKMHPENVDLLLDGVNVPIKTSQAFDGEDKPQCFQQCICPFTVASDLRHILAVVSNMLCCTRGLDTKKQSTPTQPGSVALKQKTHPNTENVTHRVATRVAHIERSWHLTPSYSAPGEERINDS